MVKNAARRLKDRGHTFTVCDQPMVWDMVHFDVQLIGGMVLHEGKIAEMATGEGKTFVAPLAFIMMSLAGKTATGDGERLSGEAGREWVGRLYIPWG